MQHFPMRVHMTMTGKHDRAGRLLTESERMLAYPNSVYWQDKCAELITDLDGAGFKDWDAFDALIDAAPEESTYAALYSKALEFAKPYVGVW